MATQFRIEFLSPSKKVASYDATSMIIPGKVGYMTILPDHATMVSELAVGEVTVRTLDGKVEKLFLSGGYLKLEDNRVLVLADVAETYAEIDLKRAEKALSRAEERLENKDISKSIDVSRANLSKDRAEFSIKIVEVMAELSRDL